MSTDDTADARRLVDELRAAGADMLKTYKVSLPTYFQVAAAARRAGMRLGGHIQTSHFGSTLSAIDASDSGASIIDHPIHGLALCWTGRRPAPVNPPEGWQPWAPADAAQCGRTAERFRRNGTWFVPTLTAGPYGAYAESIVDDWNSFSSRTIAFWDGAPLSETWLRDLPHALPPADSLALRLAQRVGLPILAGSDVSLGVQGRGGMWGGQLPGFVLHLELAAMVAEGLSPIEALRAATLNPAKMLRATDSLGTVAPGKLADLVLLDANPLVDITNTTRVRAVVADGRYFDRAELDRLLADARAESHKGVAYWTGSGTDTQRDTMTIDQWKEYWGARGLAPTPP